MKGKSKSQTEGWIEAIKGLNGQDSCPVPIVASPDPRDATIRELRALCGEAAVQLDEYLDYERAEHICIVIGDVALAAKLRAASAAQALADPGGKP